MFRQHILTLLLITSLYNGHACASALFRVNDYQVDISEFSVFVLPGDQVTVTLLQGNQPWRYYKGRIGVRQSGNEWNIQAPERSTSVTLRSQDGQHQFQLNLWVMLPFSAVQNGQIQGYEIGEYPPGHPHKKGYYTPPPGLLKVTPDMIDMSLTTHLTLRKFLSKQKSDFPKFVYLDSKMLLMLEGFMEALRKQGYPIEAFGIISGYRTPVYNASLGNITYSRHMYGDAADFYVDVDGDGKLDDLNRDGVLNEQDVRFFHGLAERFRQNYRLNDITGGMGLYMPTRKHTGFLHMDTRGYRDRWEN